MDYYPFGEVRLDESTGSFSEGHKFIGEFYDEESELSYLNARYMDGKRGQFLSQDPVFLVIGNLGELKAKTNLDLYQYLANPQGLNSYSYAFNNPIKNTDKAGNYVETAFDIAMFSLSLRDFIKNPGLGTGFGLAADGASIALPIPAFVGAIRHGDDAARFIRLAPEAQKVAKSLNWGNPESLLDHTFRHASDFNLDPFDFKGYAKVSDDFLSGAENAIKQGDTNFDSFVGTGKSAGKTFFFNNKTGLYGIRNADGTTATAYKPKGGDLQKAKNYWNNKKKTGGN